MATTFGIVLEKSMQLAHMKDYLQSKLETKINNCQPKYPVLQPWPRGAMVLRRHQCAIRSDPNLVVKTKWSTKPSSIWYECYPNSDEIKFFVFAGKRWSVIQPFHFKNDLILKEVVEETLSRLLQNFVEDYVLRGYTYGSSEEKDDSILNYTLGDICVTCQAKPHSMYMYFFYEALGGYQTYPFREQDHEGAYLVRELVEDGVDIGFTSRRQVITLYYGNSMTMERINNKRHVVWTWVFAIDPREGFMDPPHGRPNEYPTSYRVVNGHGGPYIEVLYNDQSLAMILQKIIGEGGPFLISFPNYPRRGLGRILPEIIRHIISIWAHGIVSRRHRVQLHTGRYVFSFDLTHPKAWLVVQVKTYSRCSPLYPWNVSDIQKLYGPAAFEITDKSNQELEVDDIQDNEYNDYENEDERQQVDQNQSHAYNKYEIEGVD